MSGDKNNARQILSSVDNAWIVNHSKSHPGRVYYFNTITGESVWDLSKIEIERAKMRTQVLECQPDFVKCSEPKGNPPPQDIFKKDFSKQNVSKELQTASPYSDIAVAGLSAFNFNDLNKQIKSFNLITPTVINHNPWNVPPAQFYITPSIPVLNPQTSLNVEFNQLFRNGQAEVPRFKVFDIPHRGRFQSNKSFGRGGHFNRCRTLPQKQDLRQRITLKKRLRNSVIQNTFQTKQSNVPECTITRNNVGESSSRGINVKTADISSHIANMIEEVRNTCEINNTVYNKAQAQTEETQNPECQMEEIQRKETERQENTLYLDLTPLKCLAPSNANPLIWYIVVDFKVLLEEFEFLNRIMTSDKNCCLSVPYNVMTELKDYIASSNNKPARRIFLSLSQKAETGDVLLGKKLNQDSISNSILKNCFDLIEENYHVILITNDSELLNYKKFIKVNMFTVDEIKSLLNESLHDNQSNLDPHLHSPVPTIKSPLPAQGLIQITIPGMCNITSEDKTTTEDQESEDRKVETHEKEVSKIETTQSTEMNLPSECRVDVAIQTNIAVSDVIEKDKMTHEAEMQNLVKDSNKIETTHESDVSVPPIKRKLKLKRSISHQPMPSTSVDKINEKKPIRWRSRKRFPKHQESTPNNNEHPSNSSDDIKVASIQTNTTDEISNNELRIEQTSSSGEIVESRESSIICLSAKKDSITIEETSTSGIISNTESNIDVQSENIDYTENRYDESNASNECVVRIDSEFMEDSLKTKCEEWVSRFVQIMEEVLTVVLHKEPSYSNVELPPPWTLHEAAQCIRRYSNYDAVRHASDKLSRILFLLSDSVGKITTNMTSNQYMNMYDAGVSLLAAIKAITKCEDVEIAEESLRKLLIDIKNPYSSNDSVIDHQENFQMLQELNDDSANKSQDKDVSGSKQDDQETGKYNLRSKSRKLLEERVQSPSPVKIIRNLDIKSSFLSNLNLQKRSDTSAQSDSLFSRPENRANERTCITFSSGVSNNETVHCSKPFNTPNIIRNFTKFAEFEERLRKKYDTNPFENHDEYLNYEDEYFTSVDGCSEDLDMTDEDALQSDQNETQLFESSDLDISGNLVTSSPKGVDPSLANESNNRFKYMMCMFLKEVRNAINEVKVLCDRCYAELNNPQLPKTQRNELKIQVENAHLHIDGLCLSLESMLDRDPNAPTGNIQNALKKAGINMSHVDERLLSSYWDTIANCKKHADVFLCSVREIIAGFESLSD